MAKIKPEDPLYLATVAGLKAVIEKAGGIAIVDLWIAGRKAVDGHSNNRLRWDLWTYAKVDYALVKEFYDTGGNDNHLSTMLRSVCREVGLEEIATD